MKISLLEIQNFRKLKSTHVDLNAETTIFVGANNSGKTSAMLALRYFLVSPNKLALRDITLTTGQKLTRSDGHGSKRKNCPAALNHFYQSWMFG